MYIEGIPFPVALLISVIVAFFWIYIRQGPDFKASIKYSKEATLYIWNEGDPFDKFFVAFLWTDYLILPSMLLGFFGFSPLTFWGWILYYIFFIALLIMWSFHAAESGLMDRFKAYQKRIAFTYCTKCSLPTEHTEEKKEVFCSHCGRRIR